MPLIIKIGPSDDILPSIEELRAIKAIKILMSELLIINPQELLEIIKGTDPYRREDYKIIFGYNSKGLNYAQNFDKYFYQLRYYKQSDSLAGWIAENIKFPLISWPGRIKEIDLLKIERDFRIKSVNDIWNEWYNNPENAFSYFQKVRQKSELSPVCLNIISMYYEWIYKGILYRFTGGSYSEDQIRLLVFDEFDKERRKFEHLKTKFNFTEGNPEQLYQRPRIPEQVRVEVWRRDSGKCARCGSRENLEYDHIVPISKGGSNTARNIELLCEKCNRSKGANIG